ncbi:MAG TPA: HAD family phosphatase [Bellilinea sp.]|nr:HAD family phosphatase [Bellilinea sp.]
MIKAVIFDMGGVLIRTVDHTPRLSICDRYGISRKDLEGELFFSRSTEDAEKGLKTDQEHYLTAMANLGIPAEEEKTFTDLFWGGDRMDYDLLDKIADYRKTMKTGLLSNAMKGTRKSIEERFGSIAYAFDYVIFSAEIGMRKPNPEIYHHILELVDAKPEEAIFVDDLLDNVEGANRVGIHGVHFKNPDQAIAEVEALIAAG